MREIVTGLWVDDERKLNVRRVIEATAFACSLLVATVALSGCAAMRESAERQQRMINAMTPYERAAYYDRQQRAAEMAMQFQMQYQRSQQQNMIGLQNDLARIAERSRAAAPVQVAPFNCMSMGGGMVSCQ